jgi:hypothetical protein
MPRRVLCVALIALCLLMWSGSISAEEPGPAEIVTFSSDEHRCRLPWFDSNGQLEWYYLNGMKVYANDRNGNALLHAYGTIDYAKYATIAEACDLFQGPPFNIDGPCNTQRQGAMTLSGDSTCLRWTHSVGGVIVDWTYNWTAVFSPNGNIHCRADFTPGSEVLPKQCQ